MRRFFICGDKIQKVLIMVHIICYARHMEGTHRKRSKNALDVENIKTSGRKD